MHLIGGVDAHLVAHPPLGAVPEGRGEERPVLQSWDLEAAEAELVRLEPELDPDGNPGKAPFSLTAEDVARCHHEGGGRFLDVEAGRIEAEGAFRSVIDSAQGTEPDLDGSVFVAKDTVSVDYRAAADQPGLRARGSVFVLLDGARGTLKPDKGKRVRATGVMPGNGLPYTLVARELQFQDERLEAAEPELDLTDPVEFPDLGVSFERITAGHLVATDETVVFDEGFQGFVEGNRAGRPDISLGFVEVDTQQLKGARGSNDDGQSQRTIGPFEPVPLQEPVAASQESQDDDGIDIGRTQIGGPFEVNLPTLRSGRRTPTRTPRSSGCGSSRRAWSFRSQESPSTRTCSGSTSERCSRGAAATCSSTPPARWCAAERRSSRGASSARRSSRRWWGTR